MLLKHNTEGTGSLLLQDILTLHKLLHFGTILEFIKVDELSNTGPWPLWMAINIHLEIILIHPKRTEFCNFVELVKVDDSAVRYIDSSQRGH